MNSATRVRLIRFSGVLISSVVLELSLFVFVLEIFVFFWKLRFYHFPDGVPVIYFILSFLISESNQENQIKSLDSRISPGCTVLSLIAWELPYSANGKIDCNHPFLPPFL